MSMTGMATLALYVAAGLPAHGQASERNPSPEALLEEIRRLRDAIHRQQLQLEELEKRVASSLSDEADKARKTSKSGVLPGESPPEPAESEPSSRLVDLAGYFNSAYTRVPLPGDPSGLQRQTVSLFFGKTFGNWRFHSELEYQYGTELSPSGRPVGAASGELAVETAWLDYSHRDWLAARAGILLTPTYWSTHHYPSTTLTVRNPLIHERIFPSNVMGAMVHGSRYFEEAGFDYSFYAGHGAGFHASGEAESGSGAVGGTMLVHLPTRRFFKVLDTGLQFYRDRPGPGDRQQIYGFESRIEKGRFQFLGEFAHANIGPRHTNRDFFRQGYYLQPAVRLARRWHTYYRYDWLKYDSRNTTSPFADGHTAGLNFRPVPNVSLKLEWNSYRQAGGPATTAGASAALAFFFR